MPNDQEFYPVNFAYQVSELNLAYEPVLESFYIDIYNYEEGSYFFLALDKNCEKEYSFSQAV